MNYFDKLPTITYQGQLSKNLLSRAKLSDETMANSLVFQKYATTDLDRADMLANDYYNSPGYTWLVWMSNNIIDPYYAFALPEYDFNNYIIKKYGSVAKATRDIAFFRINWDALEDTLTPEQFKAAGALKKYYEPVLNEYLQVIKYITKRDDTAVATNLIVSITIKDQVGSFKPSEEVRQTATIYGKLTSAFDSTLIVQNVLEQGSTFTVGSRITGVESGASGIIESVTVLSRPIPITEIGFWQPVSYFEAENEANEFKRNIRLLDARYKNKAEEEFKRVMRDR